MLAGENLFPGQKSEIAGEFPASVSQLLHTTSMYFSLTTITTTTTSVSQLFPADESRPMDVSGNQIMENTRSLAGP